MKHYSTFIFESYDLNKNTGRVSLRYSLDGELEFTETLTLPIEDVRLDNVDPDELEQALFALHLIGGISYYKTCLPKTIKIKSGTLKKQQALFWNSVYENGLGEFFYRNNINFRNLVSFPFEQVQDKREMAMRRSDERTRSGRVLVPIGGGKDSIVSLELLRKIGENLTLFRMGEHPIIDDIAHIAGLPLLTIKRQLSPALFELNAKGALNGHVPITAYLSFASVLVALLSGFDAIAMSNEGSANEGNVVHHGREINHQWSKSAVFERMMRDYVEKFISPHIEYFSMLRPLSELHVTKIFSNHPEYFESFTSCNANWKITQEKPNDSASAWCGHCPKCAFVYCMLSAFLQKEQLIKIFGKDLFAEESLLSLYRQLLGLDAHKPFECVGTADETKAAFLLARKRGEATGTPAMAMFEAQSLPNIKDSQALIERSLAIGNEHFIPERFASLLPSLLPKE